MTAAKWGVGAREALIGGLTSLIDDGHVWIALVGEAQVKHFKKPWYWIKGDPDPPDAETRWETVEHARVKARVKVGYTIADGVWKLDSPGEIMAEFNGTITGIRVYAAEHDREPLVTMPLPHTWGVSKGTGLHLADVAVTL